MHIVLSAWGSRGDIEPLAGLAARLRELGARVSACVPPDDEYAELVARAGAELVPLGPAVRSIVRPSAPPTLADAVRLAAELVAERFEILGRVASGADALVASGLMPAGARSVAEKLGIRYVLACFHPFGLPSPLHPPARRPGRPDPPGVTDLRELWDLDAERVNDLYLEAENRGRAALGLPPVDNVRDHVFGDGPWLAADPVLCPAAGMTFLPLWQTGAWILPDHRPLPAGLDAFLDSGPPPVYVGFGSMPMHSSTDPSRVAVDATRGLGRRVILARGRAGLAAVDERDDCLVVDDVNHQALFPRVAAVVHHGGAGTTTTAAIAGAPQVLVPQLVDQPYWARRVSELGIGAAHEGPALGPDSLAAALATALAPETRVRAREVAAAVRTDGAMLAARKLLGAAD